MKRWVLAGLGSFALVAVRSAEAAPEWVNRGITLPRFGLSFDAGLGVAHAAPFNGITGAGLNLEGAFGITSDLEIGLRTGVRFSDDSKATRADEYGRLFDTETETDATGADVFANPEFHIRGRRREHADHRAGAGGARLSAVRKRYGLRDDVRRPHRVSPRQHRATRYGRIHPLHFLPTRWRRT